ncbi:hypothetical protein ABZ626_03850 [Streptomyces longispororuber]|uniref:hypothetical protein n=1 Tax=Streptomyces longispororuber TaxID=68230 RepID=UPI0033C2C8F0
MRLVVHALRHLRLQQPLTQVDMTAYGRRGEKVDLDHLTASTITDDHLDALRAELRHYRNSDATLSMQTFDVGPPRETEERRDGRACSADETRSGTD